MIGQKRFLDNLTELIKSDNLPRYLIVVGNRGSESNLVADYVAKLLHANCVKLEDVKVDTIRDAIDEAYKVLSLTVYNIPNADAMSAQAENALLKVTEEPPNKAYFILTVEDALNLLPTMRSRGTVFTLDAYTRDELSDYLQRRYGNDDEDIYLKLCDTPGEIDLLHSMNAHEFYNFVEKVVDNIATVSGGNVFKIAQQIKFKDSDEGYDLPMFWKAFQQICFDSELYEAVQHTSTYLNALSVTKSINKSMLFDSWILDMRKVLDDGTD